jgi:hypothetical protein
MLFIQIVHFPESFIAQVSSEMRGDGRSGSTIRLPFQIPRIRIHDKVTLPDPQDPDPRLGYPSRSPRLQDPGQYITAFFMQIHNTTEEIKLKLVRIFFRVDFPISPARWDEERVGGRGCGSLVKY